MPARPDWRDPVKEKHWRRMLIRWRQRAVLLALALLAIGCAPHANVTSRVAASQQSARGLKDESSTSLVGSASSLNGPASLSRTEERYSIKISVAQTTFLCRTYHGVIAGDPPSKGEEGYTNLFAFEFNLYPVELVVNSRLRSIILCKGLRFENQLRTAIPDFEHDCLYLDVARGGYDGSYVRRVIHHEFYHIVDLHDDGQLYQDDDWNLLNPPGFRYGRGGASVQEDQFGSLPDSSIPGFLNRYAMSAVEEDKAEMFAHMMVAYAFVEDRAKHDAILQAKKSRMMELMEHFCPSMDAAYWLRIGKLQR